MQTIEVRDVFDDGYKGSRFIINTVIKKLSDNEYKCSGRITQGRAERTDDGAYIWDDAVIEAEAFSDNPNHANQAVLKSMFQHLIDSNFYLFQDREEDDTSKDDLQEV